MDAASGKAYRVSGVRSGETVPENCELPACFAAFGPLGGHCHPLRRSGSNLAVLLEIRQIFPLAAYIATVWLAYTTLSVRGLDQAAHAVIGKLKKAQLPEARAALAMIVGRDTRALDESEIMRAVIETVAENTSDGFVAPMFYLAIGGVPAAVSAPA